MLPLSPARAQLKTGLPIHDPRCKSDRSVILRSLHRPTNIPSPPAWTTTRSTSCSNASAVKTRQRFVKLYKAFSQRVYAYVLNMLNDHARAEEVLADTLYEVWRQPRRFRGESKFSTWLIGIARRKALMVFRARRPDEVHGDLEDIAETTAADTPDSFWELAGKQRREGVQHCMGKLSDKHRECLTWCF